MKNIEGGFIDANKFYAGASFKDELGDSIGTQLTEIIDRGNRPRQDDSILREEQER